MPTKEQYAACVLGFFKLEPIDPNNMGQHVTGGKGCYNGPTEYRAPGYVEGISLAVNAPIAKPFTTKGREVVYDFATMQRQVFEYESWLSYDAFSAGVSDAQYLGVVKGFKTSVVESGKYDIELDYGGRSRNLSSG